jgi:hypothetical protein
VTALSLLSWMNAPFTGVGEQSTPGDDPVGFTTLRYLVPTFTAALLTLALASRERRSGRPYALTALAVALALTAWQLFDLGYASAPRATTPLAGAAIAAAVVAAAWLALPRGIPWSRVIQVGTVPAVILVGIALSFAASGFVERYTVAVVPEAREYLSAKPQLMEWFAAQPGFEDGGRSIAFNAVTEGALAGDRLQNRIEYVRPLESCSRTHARIRAGWVVVNRTFPPRPCFGGLRPRFSKGEFVVYAEERSGRRLPPAARDSADRAGTGG